MKMICKKNTAGFSLVELLAVVLVLAILSAVAVPMYTGQRKSAAGRACKANLTAISSSLTSYALRNNAYPATLKSLVGASEGLVEIPKCPLDGSAYTYSLSNGAAKLNCPNAKLHVGYPDKAATAWQKTLPAPAADTLP